MTFVSDVMTSFWWRRCVKFMFDIITIHSGHFNSASSSPQTVRDALDTARILYRSFTPKHHSQLRAKNLPKVLTWRQERIQICDPSDERRRVFNKPPRPMIHDTPLSGVSLPLLILF